MDRSVTQRARWVGLLLMSVMAALEQACIWLARKMLRRWNTRKRCFCMNGRTISSILHRVDSIGGAHSFGNNLDMRVAFGEGLANALSSIFRNDPKHLRPMGKQQAEG